MRPLVLASTTLAALISLAPMAFAAPTHTHHRVPPSHHTRYQMRMPAAPAGYPANELWPRCYGGDACTAAGYPNLHYWREIQGLPY
jgi:hypothetical protein